MTREEIFAEVIRTVHNSLPELDTDSLTEDSVLAELGVESMAFILILCRLEASLQMEVPESEWPQILTLGDVADAIGRHLPGT